MSILLCQVSFIYMRGIWTACQKPKVPLNMETDMFFLLQSRRPLGGGFEPEWW